MRDQGLVADEFGSAPGDRDQDDADRHHRLAPGALLFLLVAAVLVWAWLWFTAPENMPIRNVRVEGEFHRLSPSMLQDLATDVVRGGFFNVNVETIQRTLLANPWVHRVTVMRVWPDGLKVMVTEQVAIACWGEDGLLNAEAEFFAPGLDACPQNLPVFNGPANTCSLMMNRYQQIRAALATAGIELSTLTLSPRRAWSFQVTGGPRVVLGRRDVTGRITRFSYYVAASIAHQLDRIDVVDMRYTNGFAVRWREPGRVSIVGNRNHGEKS